MSLEKVRLNAKKWVEKVYFCVDLSLGKVYI